jgi:hypothetical protein
LHHDRLRQIAAIRSQAETLGLSVFFYFFTGLWTGIGLHFSGKGRDVRFRPLPFSKYVEKLSASKVVVDLPHPLQTGLTMRAIETIGAGKKLMTTALDVSAYEFHRPENVSVLDSEHPRIDPAFLAVPQLALPAETIEPYGLRAWSLDVLGVTEPRDFLSATGADRAV